MTKLNQTNEPEGNIRPHSALRTASRVVCGIAFVAAAVVVLLNVFGVITLSINIGIFVALAALAIIAIYSAFHLFWAGLFFLTATIITIMSANDLVFSLSGAQVGSLYIAAALLTVAFHLIFKKSVLGIGISHGSDANFGSGVKYFEGDLDTASLECNFGGIKAYFENAKPIDGKAVVKVECNFGGVELYIPKTWKVIDKVNAAFGGVEEKNRPTPTEKSPTLTILGEVNFGGLTIVYV